MRNPGEEPAPVIPEVEQEVEQEAKPEEEVEPEEEPEEEVEPEEEPTCDSCGGSGDLHEVGRQMLCGDCSFECDGCESWCPSDDKVGTEEGDRCQQCVDNDFASCGSCGRIVRSDETTTVQPGDQTWCERCTDRNATSCDRCDEYFEGERGVTHLQDTNTDLCRDCYDNSDAFYCQGCDENYSYGAYGGSNDDGSYCTSCHTEEEGSVPGYHNHKRRWNRFGSSARDIYYGVELEAVNDEIYDDFAETAEEVVSKFGYIGSKEFLFTEDDPSLKDRGFETIMHPMSSEFIRENKELFKKILDLMVRRHMVSYEAPKQGISAGMHVTMSWDPFTKTQKQKFLQLIFQNKEFTTLISRRRQGDLNQWARVEAPEKIEAMAEFKEGYGEKYHAVHLKTCTNHVGDKIDLAEVRIFRGTLKLESFLMNLEYVIACSDFACSDSATGATIDFQDTTAKNLLAYVSERRKDYPHLYAWLKEKGLIT
jgi:hypothetical protein